jgi:hypothetical protein
MELDELAREAYSLDGITGRVPIRMVPVGEHPKGLPKFPRREIGRQASAERIQPFEGGLRARGQRAQGSVSGSARGALRVWPSRAACRLVSGEWRDARAERRGKLEDERLRR